MTQNLKGFGQVINRKYRATFNDIFKKIDLNLNGLVYASDLNLLGSITGIKFLQNIVEKDFNKGGKLASFPGTDKGLTQQGFALLLASGKIPDAELQAGLRAMGYDEFLNNSKSRTFVLSIHSEAKINARVGDALKNNYQFVAMNLLNDALIRSKNHQEVRKESNYVLLQSQFPECKGTSFYIVNLSSAPLRVKFTFRNQNEFYFSPSCGS